jgi:transposase
VDWVHQGLHRTVEVARQLQEKWHKTVSVWTLRRLFRQGGLSYKRIRKSGRHLRNEQDYQFFKAEMQALQALEDSGEIDLYYFDEMGVNLQAIVPYGWQQKGNSEAFMPATQSQNLTTLAFLKRNNHLSAFTCPGAATSEVVVACMDEFLQTIHKKTVVVMDNASTHRSKLFESKYQEWRSKGLLIQFIPPYCPELNLIEILWKQIKHHWLNPKDFLTKLSLQHALENILQAFGTKYHITFA